METLRSSDINAQRQPGRSDTLFSIGNDRKVSASDGLGLRFYSAKMADLTNAKCHLRTIRTCLNDEVLTVARHRCNQRSKTDSTSNLCFKTLFRAACQEWCVTMFGTAVNVSGVTHRISSIIVRLHFNLLRCSQIG